MTSPEQERPAQEELPSQQAEQQQSLEKSDTEKEADFPSKDIDNVGGEAEAEEKTDQNPSTTLDDAQKAPAVVPGSPAESLESGEASPIEPSDPIHKKQKDGDESGAPPLPNEPPPEEASKGNEDDDGWDFHWDAANQAYFFYNRFTNETTWENPRTEAATQGGGGGALGGSAGEAGPAPPQNELPPAGGYNPAIHGDYDPNAWYAQGQGQQIPENNTAALAAAEAGATGGGGDNIYSAVGSFNAATGRWQQQQNPGGGGNHHSDDAKSHRQMSAYFDVDAASSHHQQYAANDGRILGSERSGQKLSKAKLKHYREKNRAKKEEKKRAWLRD